MGSCGVDVSGSATTVVPIGPTDFATIPPVQTTLPNTTTTLPPGAIGVEQEYIVQAGIPATKLAAQPQSAAGRAQSGAGA